MPSAPAPQPTISFLLWLVPTVDRFPKRQKFVFGDRILNLALDVLEPLMEATYATCCGA
jgi:hypothetical protein